jgi:hypothetical protein
MAPEKITEKMYMEILGNVNAVFVHHKCYLYFLE